MLKKAIFGLVLFLISCSTTTKVTESPKYSNHPNEQQDLKMAQKKADESQWGAALELFDNFTIKYPNSVYTQAAVLAKADMQMKLQLYSEASVSYRSVIEKTREFQPEIAATAMYKLSYPYEEMGDEARLIATLEDAMKFQEHLDPGITAAEIPARIGAAYLRLGMLEESRKYFFQAQNGISRIKSMEPDKDYLASIYFRMGNFSTHQGSFETLKVLMETMSGLQIYMLKCIELGAEKNSQVCYDQLLNYYQEFYEQIQKAPLNQTLDRQAALRQQRFTQAQLTESLLESIQDLWSYRAVDLLSQQNSKNFFDELTTFEKKLSNDLLKLDLSMPQTFESIDRVGTIPTFVDDTKEIQESESESTSQGKDNEP